MTTYDSRDDTLKHIGRVQELLNEVIDNLDRRADVHDASKLEEPEKSLLDQIQTQTNLPEYGSPEEVARRDALATFREEHYKHNLHHPEHWPNGLADMSLLDLLEMLCDWHAAGARHVGGSLEKSLAYNKERFNIPEPLYAILVNTARELGWL